MSSNAQKIQLYHSHILEIKEGRDVSEPINTDCLRFVRKTPTKSLNLIESTKKEYLKSWALVLKWQHQFSDLQERLKEHEGCDRKKNYGDVTKPTVMCTRKVPPVSKQSGMDELHKKILRENRCFLVHEIQDVEGISDILLEKHILTNSMNQEILAEKTKIAKVRKLLDTVPKRGQHAFEIFCNALIKTGQRHIAEKLNPELRNSGVTAVPPEPVPDKDKTVDSKAISQQENTKQTHSKPSYPVPCQVPINSDKKTSGTPGNIKEPSLPDPFFPTGMTAGSQPSDDEVCKPTLGRQESTPYPPSDKSDEELLKNFPNPKPNWPSKLDMALNSREFEVKPCTDDELKSQLSDLNRYQMPKGKVKRAIIISNWMFEMKQYKDRMVDMDSFRIQQVFKKLGFSFKPPATNVDKETLMKLLKKETNTEDDLCVFVLVILSYGGKGTVMCSDGKPFPIQDILDLFSTENCPSMAGVPKLFLLQACGAILKDFSEQDEEGINTGIENLNMEASGGGKTVADTKGSLHTSESETSLSDCLTPGDDMLVAVATTADENQAGYSSLFMLGLSNIICNFAKSDHFITLLKGVNRLKKSDDSEEAVKLCEFKHSLTRKLYLLPGTIQV